MLKNWQWKPPGNWRVFKTIDLHTGGEPLRVFTAGLPEIKGQTILEKRRYFRDHYDFIRTGILWEPRGHADMYGAVITEPTTADADFGVFFLHNEGYSTMCGHAIIALVKLVLDTGMIVRAGDEPVLIIDVPAGQITARAFRKNGQVEKVSFQNVPSFLYMQNQRVDVPGIGPVDFDLAFGGAFYAFVDSDQLRLKISAANHNRLIDLGRQIKHSIIRNFAIIHPFEPDLSFLYGTIITGQPVSPVHHSQNVCIFAEGEVDRSPTGTGISGRVAIHYARGEIALNHPIVIESIIGSSFTGRVVGTTTFGPYAAVLPEVEGRAFITGRNEFLIDPNDPLKHGFILR